MQLAPLALASVQKGSMELERRSWCRVVMLWVVLLLLLAGCANPIY
jgi:hypothetical protein